ncbi:MAG: ferrous iron transporter B, partial [Chloroflexota bacterium]
KMPVAPISARALSILWLCNDSVAAEWLRDQVDAAQYQALETRREQILKTFSEPVSSIIQQTRAAFIEQVAEASLTRSGNRWQGVAATAGRLATHPLWGLPILAAVLYALYWFVGIFGAGTLVGLLENRLFGEILNPMITEWVRRLIPIPFISDFLVGEYGMWTIGVTYAVALLFPIVTTFFLAFGMMEDSGYLPRLAVLTNRLFESIGLNGKAVVPMVLGLGCVTMATLTTRTLESKRDRWLVTLLLALAVPCSAQLGVVIGMLAGISLSATLIWSGVMLLILLVVGWLAARLAPGERSTLLVELPPLRVPVISNVIVKTLARLEWYLKEVVPMFLFGTALLFALDKFHILPWIIKAGEPLVTGWLGLPAEASSAFLLGFLRRDFAATGLFAMESKGLLSPLQVVVSMVTITIFIPCIASAFMIAKERSKRTAIAMIALIFPLAFLIGGILNRLLMVIGWRG